MNLKKTQIDELTIAYLDIGSGPPVLMAHCSSASHKEWQFLTNDRPFARRIVAPDLIGYGKSHVWPFDERMPYDADVAVLEHLLDVIGEPVDVIGHSYGAAMCLEVARREVLRGSGRIKSMVLIEPVSFHLLRDGANKKAWRIADRVASGCIQHVDAGHFRKAADIYMRFWLGALRWHFAPKRLRAAVIRTVAKVADEFRGIYASEADKEEFRAIQIPVTLIRGTRTRLPASTVVDILADLLPIATVIEIQGAGHMSPFTHPDEIRDLCHAHLDRFSLAA